MHCRSVDLYIVGTWAINPLHTTGLFLQLLKTSENLCFSDVLRGYKRRPVERNGLINELTFKPLVNPFHATVVFLHPLERQRTKGFLMFSEGIERDLRPKMGYHKIKRKYDQDQQYSLTHFSPVSHFYTP